LSSFVRANAGLVIDSDRIALMGAWAGGCSLPLLGRAEEIIE
jgi:hypothetical protein